MIIQFKSYTLKANLIDSDLIMCKENMPVSIKYILDTYFENYIERCSIYRAPKILLYFIEPDKFLSTVYLYDLESDTILRKWINQNNNVCYINEAYKYTRISVNASNHKYSVSDKVIFRSYGDLYPGTIIAVYKSDYSTYYQIDYNSTESRLDQDGDLDTMFDDTSDLIHEEDILNLLESN